MTTPSVLVIDQDEERRDELRIILEFLEYSPEFVLDCDRWREGFDACTDLETVLLVFGPDEERLLPAFRQIRAHNHYIPIVVVIDESSELALDKELNTGSIAKIGLPIRQKELHTALQRVRMYRESRHLAGGPRSIELFRNLVGSSEAIRRVRRLIEQVANTDASVLLTGESGTGKEVVARNIHFHSSRRHKPFVPVNCGAIHSELLESELFGHEKGAFTGAISTRRGRFEMADGGTLFLDEVGDMPLAMQVKLLRVIQEKTFERVGSNKSIHMDVRIITATHRNLDEAIEAGQFRKDLYYRLSVFPIEMPGLRHRIEDMPLLINDLFSRMDSEKSGAIRLSPAAMRYLASYPWPGNVRELANLVERLLILYPGGVVDAHDLPEKYRTVPGATPAEESDDNLKFPGLMMPAQTLPAEGIDLKGHLEKIEYNLIQQALKESGGVVAQAAKRLSLGRTTLVEKMRKFGLSRQDNVSNI